MRPPRLVRDHGVDLAADPMAVQRLKEAAEKAKIELSQVQQTQINLPFVTATDAGPLHLDYTLSRAKFQELTADLLGRCRTPFKQAIKDAGLGKGAAIGTGRADANRETAMTNFLGALAQCEAAMEVFRDQGHGHLVMVSSMSAMRGMPKSMTTYAATKAGVAHLAEGIRTELHGTPLAKKIQVTVLYPGYIASEMNEKVQQSTPLMASTEKGVKAMVAAIEKQVDSACVPALPWAPMSVVMKHAPLPVLKRLI